MSFKVKKYLDRENQQKYNIWDDSKKAWVFDYENPKYRICSAELNIPKKKIFEIIDNKGEKSYLYDAISKSNYTLGIDGISFKKPLYVSDVCDVNIYVTDKKETYVVFTKSGKYFKIPTIKDEITFINISKDHLYIQYDTNEIEDTKNGNYYRHTVRYYKIFDVQTGEEYFKDYYITNLLLNSFSKFNVLAFNDNDNTYFISKDKIIKIYENYIPSNVDEVIAYGKKNECYNLIQKERYYAFKNDTVIDKEHIHNIIVNKNGKIIFEIDGLFLSDLCSGFILKNYHSGAGILNYSKTYGENFGNEWFIYFTKENYARIIDKDLNNLLKYNDITDIKIYINSKGEIYYLCTRNNLIYIYDEQWNCLTDKWVIYQKYTIKNEHWYSYNDQFHYDELERAIIFDFENDIFDFYHPHAKLNDGSRNTMDDYLDPDKLVNKQVF